MGELPRAANEATPAMRLPAACLLGEGVGEGRGLRGEMWLRLKLDVRLVRPLGARKCALIGRELLHEPGESTGERERNGDGERGVRVGEVEVPTVVRGGEVEPSVQSTCVRIGRPS